MKKTVTIALAVIAVIAVVLSFVFGSQRGNLQKTVDDVNAQLKAVTDEKAALETAKTDLEAQLAEAQAAAEAAKTEAETKVAEAATAAEAKLAEATSAAESAKSELEKKLAEVTSAADTTKTALETQLADAAKAAETVRADLETRLSDAQAAAETAKGEAETKLAEATKAAETVKADLEAKLAEATKATETVKADLEAKLAEAAKTTETVKADLEAQLAEAAKATEAVRADLEKQTAAAAEAEAAKNALASEKASLEDALAVATAETETVKAELAKAERKIIAAGANAYIMYANADWSVQNWGVDDNDEAGVKVNPARVTGAGTYTTSLEFATPAEGVAFTALGIDKAEREFPGGTIEIKAIRINGEPVEFGKGYTSSDDGKVTRMNIYNEWVSALPADARRADQDLTDAAPVIVDKEAFASVSTMEVEFEYLPLSAYLMFANADWSVQNWGVVSGQEGVTVGASTLDGEGSYNVRLDFDQPSEGLAFLAIGIKNGEMTFPGYIIRATKVTVNDGEENLLTGVGYTNSDDGRETRENLYNEWVSALPDDARNQEGLENASPLIIGKDAFTGVKSISVDFQYIKAQPAAAAAEAAFTEEQIQAMKDAGFHAYLGVQSTSYIFRNSWDEGSYGRDADNGYFTHLVGWDSDNNAVDYGGSFTDAEMTGDGEYTVTMKTGEMGFGTDSAFRLLFVSTDIPSSLITDGYLKIENVKIKGISGATQEYTDVDTTGDYARIIIIDEYNRSGDPFGYTVPGADSEISITFTVSGW